MKNIYTSDLNVLLQLYAPENYTVQLFDPYSKLNEDEDFNWYHGTAEKSILINLGDHIQEYRGRDISEFELVLNFGKCKSLRHPYHKCFSFIKDPEKRIRWYFQNRNLASILPFYNNSGWRGEFISKALQTIHFLRITPLVTSGQLNISSTQPFKIEEKGKINSGEEYSIFSGTKSSQRSAIIATFNAKEVVSYLKIPLTKPAAEVLQKEKRVLHKLSHSTINSFEFATDDSQHALLLKTNNLKRNGYKRTDKITPQHISTILELANKNIQIRPIESSQFWEDSLDKIWEMSRSKEKTIHNLYNELISLKNIIDENSYIATSASHGDFTPWNVFHSKKELALIDWELYSDNSTPLYDLFHYVYQRGILMRKNDSEQIVTDLKNAFENYPELQGYLNAFNIDFNTCHRLYLLKTASYFGALYSNNELTIQQKWQIDTWSRAIEYQLIDDNKAKQRSVFIMKLNDHLQAIPHAFMKFNFSSIKNIPDTSDLDIIVKKTDRENLLNFCKNNAQAKMSIRKKSFMTTIELFFENNEFLSLDFIHDFKRKENRMLNIQTVIAQAKMGPLGVKVPDLKHDLEYAFLFYTLNDSSIPKKYWSFFDQENLLYKYEAVFYLNEKYGLDFDNMLELFQFKIPAVKSRILKTIQNSRLSLWNKFKLKANYLVDTIKSAWLHPGFIITFSGVDGAGKSTVIEIVKKELSEKYRKDIVQLRHRPSILPMLNAYRVGAAKAEEIATVTLPRKGSNNSVLSSAIRFSYYYTDYLLGQVYIYFKFIIRGKVIIYDRYYFDFITDPKRSNIQLSKTVVKALYSLILKPKLNFFLYADSQVILKRKKELDAETIDKLSASYKGLFNELNKKEKNSKYIALENIELPKTLKSVFSEFQKVA